MNASPGPASVQFLAEAIPVLKAGLDVVPPGGRKRQGSKAERLHAYLRFQDAAHAALMWPGWLTVTEQAVRAKDVTAAQVWADLAQSRGAAAELLAALSEVRIVGNPEPRRLAEEIATLLVELMDAKLPGTPSSVRLKVAGGIYARAGRPAVEAARDRFPAISDTVDSIQAHVDPEVRQEAQRRFSDCQRALGLWHKKFVLACRDDLGYGSPWWQRSSCPRRGRWQFWRKPDLWPGGWPPPDAADLIGDARQEWKARDAAAEDG